MPSYDYYLARARQIAAARAGDDLGLGEGDPDRPMLDFYGREVYRRPGYRNRYRNER